MRQTKFEQIQQTLYGLRHYLSSQMIFYLKKRMYANSLVIELIFFFIFKCRHLKCLNLLFYCNYLIIIFFILKPPK